MTAIAEPRQERVVSMPEVMSAVARLQAATDALAAVAARAATFDSAAVDPEISAGIDAVLAAAGFPDLTGLEPQQRAMLASYIRSAFAQARDLVERPTRSAGWSYTDETVLEGQGRGSMTVPPMIAAGGDFGDVGSLLDVGTGVGWFAVGAARQWPASSIVGIDVWEPALERARRNVAGAGLADRIEVRNERVEDLRDRDRFDLAWLPSFFIPPHAVPVAFERILAATKPGGHLVVGRYDAPPDELAHATLKLRTIRDGGSWLEADEIVELLRAAGWSDVRTLPKPGPFSLMLVAARKP